MCLPFEAEQARIPKADLHASASEMILSEPRSDAFCEQINNYPDILVCQKVPWRGPTIANAFDGRENFPLLVLGDGCVIQTVGKSPEQ